LESKTDFFAGSYFGDFRKLDISLGAVSFLKSDSREVIEELCEYGFDKLQKKTKTKTVRTAKFAIVV